MFSTCFYCQLENLLALKTNKKQVEKQLKNSYCEHPPLQILGKWKKNRCRPVFWSVWQGSSLQTLLVLGNPSYEAAIVSIYQELEELSLDLEVEILDFELLNNLDVDMENPLSPTSPSSVSSHTLSDV